MVPGTSGAARTRPPRPAVPGPPAVLPDSQPLQQETPGCQTPLAQVWTCLGSHESCHDGEMCWECLHSAAAVNAQMDTAGVQAGPPPAEPQPSFAEAAGLSPRPPVASSSPCTPGGFPLASGLCGLIRVQLESPKQDVPGGIDRCPASVGKPGKTQEAGKQARVPRAFSATLQ